MSRGLGDVYKRQVLRADDDEEGTSVLTTGTLAKKVKVIYNIVVVHSDESIESGR